MDEPLPVGGQGTFDEQHEGPVPTVSTYDPGPSKVVHSGGGPRWQRRPQGDGGGELRLAKLRASTPSLKLPRHLRVHEVRDLPEPPRSSRTRKTISFVEKVPTAGRLRCSAVPNAASWDPRLVRRCPAPPSVIGAAKPADRGGRKWIEVPPLFTALGGIGEGAGACLSCLQLVIVFDACGQTHNADSHEFVGRPA